MALPGGKLAIPLQMSYELTHFMGYRFALLITPVKRLAVLWILIIFG